MIISSSKTPLSLEVVPVLLFLLYILIPESGSRLSKSITYPFIVIVAYARQGEENSKKRRAMKLLQTFYTAYIRCGNAKDIQISL